MWMSRRRPVKTKAAFPRPAGFLLARSSVIVDKKERTMKILTRTLLAVVLTAGVFAQQPAKDQPAKKDSTEAREPAAQDSFYKLSFSVYELEAGKRINQRDYMMIGKTN